MNTLCEGYPSTFIANPFDKYLHHHGYLELFAIRIQLTGYLLTFNLTSFGVYLHHHGYLKLLAI